MANKAASKAAVNVGQASRLCGMENTTVKSIYKYLEPARLDVLESGMVAFTPPGRFNDPFEMNPAVKLDVTDACLDADYSQYERE